MERTLSQNEAEVVLDLEWRGQRTVTLAELREKLNASEGYARLLAHRLVKKSRLERLRPGLFQLVPAERGREGVADTHTLTVGAALVDPYFFSYGTACTHHGLTEQAFAEVYLACQKRRRAETIRTKRYVFAESSCDPGTWWRTCPATCSRRRIGPEFPTAQRRTHRQRRPGRIGS